MALQEGNHDRTVMIGERLSKEQVLQLTILLRKFKNFFPFYHAEMSRIDPTKVMHSLNIRSTCKLVKQRKRMMNSDKIIASIAKSEKFLQVGFINEV